MRVAFALFSLAVLACSSVESSDATDARLPDASVDAPVCTSDSCPTGYDCDPQLGCVARYGKSADRPGTSCADILRTLVTAPDGAYWIDPDGGAADNSFEVYCDMTTAGGGWVLVYKYIGSDDASQVELLATDFAGPTDTRAALADDRQDAIQRRAYDAFLTAKGRTWMSRWTLYEIDDREADRNFALFELDNQVAWSDVYTFTDGCTALPGRVTVKVFDDVTRQLVTIGSSSYRFVAEADGRGFLAADASQPAYADLCGQAADNVLHWPAEIRFDSRLNATWNNAIAHLWYSRTEKDIDKDRCAWRCWPPDESLYSGREWFVR